MNLMKSLDLLNLAWRPSVTVDLVDWQQVLKGWAKAWERDFYIRRMRLLVDDRLCCML